MLTVTDKKADALAATVLVIIAAIDVSGDHDLPQDLRTKRNASMTAVGDIEPDGPHVAERPLLSGFAGGQSMAGTVRLARCGPSPWRTGAGIH